MSKPDFKALLKKAKEQEKLRGTYIEPLEIELLDTPKYAYDIPREIPIRKKSHWKVLAYPKIIPRILHSNVECYGFLMGDKGIVEDVYLPPGQKASGGHVRLDDDAVYKARKYLEKSPYSVIGWWHSHADFGTFHSEHADKPNFKRLVSVTSAYQEYDGKEIKYAYSIVVNQAGKTFNSIAVSDKEGSIRATKNSIPLKILPGGPDFDSNELRREVRERINAPPSKPMISLADAFKTLRKWLYGIGYEKKPPEPNVIVNQYVKKEGGDEVLDVVSLICDGLAPTSLYSSWESEIIKTMREKKVSLSEAIKLVGTNILERGVKEKYVV